MRISRPLLAVAAIALAVSSSSAPAQTITYSNTTNIKGTVVTPGGATGAPGTTRYTYLLADDLTYNPLSALTPVTQFKFSIANGDDATLSIVPTVNFYSNDGSGGGPGTLIAMFNFNAVSVTGHSTFTPFTYNVPLAQQFLLPVTGTVWAGMYFSSSTLTMAQMNSDFGEWVFDPATVGSTQDRDFLSSTVGPFTSSNPPGAVRNFPYGANPVASYYWEITTAAPAVPEPSTWVVAAGAGILSLFLRARSLTGSGASKQKATL
jgi:hypothetical protein